MTNGSTAQYAKVQLWDCNGTGAQVWRELGPDLHIINPQSQKCLGVNPSLNGDFQLRIESCEYNWPIVSEQLWTFPSTYEQIAGCHRSRSAAAYIGGGVNGVNFSCSGAQTSTIERNDEGHYKPGIDFAHRPAGLPDNHKGQALLLQEFARTHNVKAVALLIGANNLGYSAILTQCIKDWFLSVDFARDYCLRMAYNNGSPIDVDCRPEPSGGLNDRGERGVSVTRPQMTSWGRPMGAAIAGSRPSF